ncbi:MAG: HTH domain-containing protein, partial [Streptococcaceae bacterium]|nr:HTH domain-containing protein [Streptococcaceae bacterium]
MSVVIQQKEFLQLLGVHKTILLEEVEKNLGLTKRTIRLMIESFDIEYPQIFQVIEKDGYVELLLKDKQVFDQLLNENMLADSDFNSFHKRQAVIIDLLLKENDYLSSDYLAEEVQVSRRTLTRDIGQLKQLLSIYDLKLESKHGVGVKISGDELNLRLLTFYESLDFLDEPYQLSEEIEQIIERIIQKNKLSYEVGHLLRKAIIVSFLGKNSELISENLTYFRTSFVKDELIDLLIQAVEKKLERTLSENEKIFLTFPLNLGLFPKSFPQEHLLELTKKALVETVYEYNLKFSVDETNALLNNHLLHMINRTIMKYHRVDTLLRQDLLKSSFAAVVSAHFLNTLQKSMDMNIHQSETILLSTWFELILARSTKPLIRKIALVTQGGFSFNELILHELKNFFGLNIEVEFYNLNNHPHYDEMMRNFDLVFTDNLLHQTDLDEPLFSLSIVTK